MNYQRIYQYRFHNIDQDKRLGVWEQISHFLYDYLGNPQRVLDPAAGRCEFLNAFPALEKWGVDINSDIQKYAHKEIKQLIGNIFDVQLPSNYFDLVFVSNFLEHLPDIETCHLLVERLKESLKIGGALVIMGPNFRYTQDNYFDYADHKLALNDNAVKELIYSAGFEVDENISKDKFIPYSFKGKLPPSAFLTKWYLRFPLAWKFLGKQFLIVGRKEIEH